MVAGEKVCEKGNVVFSTHNKTSIFIWRYECHANNQQYTYKITHKQTQTNLLEIKLYKYLCQHLNDTHLSIKHEWNKTETIDQN